MFRFPEMISTLRDLKNSEFASSTSFGRFHPLILTLAVLKTPRFRLECSYNLPWYSRIRLTLLLVYSRIKNLATLLLQEVSGGSKWSQGRFTAIQGRFRSVKGVSGRFRSVSGSLRGIPEQQGNFRGQQRVSGSTRAHFKGSNGRFIESQGRPRRLQGVYWV